MKPDDTTLHLNAEEREALQRVLEYAMRAPSLGLISDDTRLTDIYLLQDRLDAAITDSLAKEGGQ